MSPSDSVTVAALYETYCKWAEKQRSKPMTKRSFSDGLVERGNAHGYTRGNGAKNVSMFFGVRVRGFEDAPETISEVEPLPSGGA